MRPRISVVVPTYRRPDLLQRGLAALAHQDLPRDAYEVIVCDDAPEEPVRQLVDEWNSARPTGPRFRYVPVTGTQGPAGARNRGWEAAQADVVAFTDDDTVPHPEWLREGLAAIEAGADAVTGRVVVPMPRDRRPTDYEKDIARMQEAEFVTANCFVRREVLSRLGGFDERFTAAWREDSDLHFKLLEAGCRLARARRAIVEHPVREAAFASGIAGHRKIAFDALLYKKHPRLYRERIRRGPPLLYYAIVAALAAMLGGIVAHSPAATALGLFAWVCLTGVLLARRMHGTSVGARHVLELVVTSVAIPVVAVYWRLTGAMRYRVPFL